MTSSRKALRGFSLIELLCVIAIIGVLAMVVVVASVSARNKGVDGSIRESLVNARSQAEVYYANNGNSYYLGVCGAAPAGSVKSINEIILSAARAYGIGTVNTTVSTTGAAGTATCHDNLSGWAAEVPLKQGGFFCVDSTSASATSSTFLLSANDINCGLP